MVVKSYRGLLDDGGQDKIRLTTTDGLKGYRIIKFQIIGDEPGEQNIECTVKIYKSYQEGTIDNYVNFSDADLLAVAYYQDAHDVYQDSIQIIFDQEIFNQDIYITAEDTRGSRPINYYFELEQIKLTVAQAELLIVKDLRKEVWTRP